MRCTGEISFYHRSYVLYFAEYIQFFFSDFRVCVGQKKELLIFLSDNTNKAPKYESLGFAWFLGQVMLLALLTPKHQSRKRWTKKWLRYFFLILF
jgi:hypothetical protein